MLLKKIYEHKLDHYRKNIESEMQTQINIHAPDPEIHAMLVSAVENGRRFRPLLFLLAHKIFVRDVSDQVFSLAAAVELLHKASLIHDDLLDGDQYRRGKASFYHTYGERTAVIAGDLLVSLAFEQFLHNTHDSYLIREWSTLYRRLALGEMQDLVWEGQWGISEAQLYQMIDGKTASFLQFAMKAGCYLATQDDSTSHQMGQIGKELGFAFQIMNDINNWQGLEKELGRNPQWDITSGKVNLITRLVYQYQQSGTDLSQVHDTILSTARGYAQAHIDSAQKILTELTVSNQYTQVLQYLMNEFDQKWFWVERDGNGNTSD